VKRALAGLVCAVASSACTTPPPYPGSELMGTFTFVAQPMENACLDLYSDPGNFPADGGPGVAYGFTATLSRTPADGGVWLTFPGQGPLQPQSWPAQFDGQYFDVTMAAGRQLTCDGGVGQVAAVCDSNVLQITETLQLALFSTSQAGVVGNHCPPNPLDGGVPLASDAGADGGVLPPGDRPTGFDAVLACGQMSDAVQPNTDAGCQCPACLLFEAVSGVRS
jgi:hypothetical protein